MYAGDLPISPPPWWYHRMLPEILFQEVRDPQEWSVRESEASYGREG